MECLYLLSKVSLPAAVQLIAEPNPKFVAPPLEANRLINNI